MESHLLQMRGLKHYMDFISADNTSHLLQMRGLKPTPWQKIVSLIAVASFTDAWIETKTKRPHYHLLLSHLLQMRGLKQRAFRNSYQNPLSHLLQMRGLKLSASTRNSGGTSSHLLQMRGLKPEKPSLNLRACLVASFTDAWIETVNAF